MLKFSTMHTVLFITEGVHDMLVIIGEQANFSCSAVGIEVDIEWTVDGTEYDSCPPGRDSVICYESSYMNVTATNKKYSYHY